MQERKRLDVTVVYLHQAFISFVVLYKRGFVMFGVVSLTMGNSLLPLADRLAAHADGLRHELLGHLPPGAVLPQGLLQGALDGVFLLPDLLGPDVGEEGPAHEHEQENGRQEHEQGDGQYK